MVKKKTFATKPHALPHIHGPLSFTLPQYRCCKTLHRRRPRHTTDRPDIETRTRGSAVSRPGTGKKRSPTGMRTVLLSRCRRHSASAHYSDNRALLRRRALCKSPHCRCTQFLQTETTTERTPKTVHIKYRLSADSAFRGTQTVRTFQHVDVGAREARHEEGLVQADYIGLGAASLADAMRERGELQKAHNGNEKNSDGSRTRFDGQHDR